MRPVNLLPEQYRPVVSTGGRSGSAYLVLGALALALVAVLAYVVTASQVSSRQAEAARLASEASAAEARVAALAPFGRFAELRATRTAAVEELARGRLDWERLSRELALLLPKGAWLSSLKGSTNADAAAAASSPQPVTQAPAGSAEPAGPTVTLSGCARNQTTVADLLVRLRRLNGAQDVDLKHSQRSGNDDGDATQGPAGAAGCGRLFSFEATVELTAPVGAEVTPGKDERVPVSLGGGS